MVDRSLDQPTIEKSFAQNHLTMVDRSCDLSTMEKTFAQGRIMHLQSIFHYGDFINAAIRECLFSASPYCDLLFFNFEEQHYLGIIVHGFHLGF